jgi:hypothetical protein
VKNTNFAVGGYWHCDKCGEEYHSSRHHTCEPPVTDRPDEGDKDAMTLLYGLTPGGSEFHNDPANCVHFIKRKFESDFKAIKRMKRERDTAESHLAAERTRREEAEAKVEMDGKFIAGIIALVKPVLDKDADFRERVQDLAFKHRVMDEYPAQDSADGESQHLTNK